MNNKAKPNKEKKVNMIKSIVRYFSEVKGELKRVTWSTKSQLINQTIVVLVSCLLIGIVIWIADGAIGKLRNLVYGL